MSDLYTFVPYHSEGLGVAYNQCCAAVPGPDDVVGLLDSDVMLFGHWGEVVVSAVEKCPQFAMLTCSATRTHASSHAQQHPGDREERDLVSLKARCTKALQKTFIVMPAEGSVSGFAMFFRRRVWDEHPFPALGTKNHPVLGIDTAWVRSLRAAGKRVGVIVNLVALHYYRLGEGDRSVEHLS